MTDPEKIIIKEEKSGMGQFGKITSVEQLISREILLSYIGEARGLIDQGKKLKVNKVSTKKHYEIPQALLDVLDANVLSKAGFNGLSSSQRTENNKWISEAKTEATRSKRVNQVGINLEEGKPLNWKYMKKWQAK
ncbi:MAG: hypothetical protein ACI837_000440 [Crocinitomicaceae bacterium]|jgi:uncharacterized protein YdeI (YjbR/CyaY-like superfamily)